MINDTLISLMADMERELYWFREAEVGDKPPTPYLYSLYARNPELFKEWKALTAAMEEQQSIVNSLFQSPKEETINLVSLNRKIHTSVGLIIVQCRYCNKFSSSEEWDEATILNFCDTGRYVDRLRIISILETITIRLYSTKHFCPVCHKDNTGENVLDAISREKSTIGEIRNRIKKILTKPKYLIIGLDV